MKQVFKKPITIAVDGYSSTGKSTMAKALAKRLGYNYIDTGAMYRAVTLFALKKGMFNEKGVLQEQALEKELNQIELRFARNNAMHLNGVDVEDEIRTMRVSEKVSVVAAIPTVRKKLVAEQQEMGKQGGVVMDGRDIGTVVFPNAELKIFMTADTMIRAKRRQEELSRKGEDLPIEVVKRNLMERDEMDSTREESPLIKAVDAKVLDNSKLSREQQLDLAEKWATEAGT